MIDKIKLMPKVELHLHLDGSISIELASKLSGLSKEECFEKIVAPDKCSDLGEYLTKFAFPISLMQTKENLELIASDLVNRLVKENVIYAEIRFAPMFHTKKGLKVDEIIEAVLKGLNSNKNIKTNLILSLKRECNLFDNLKIITLARKYLHKGVCAIDLAGDEKKYPLEYSYLYFKLAKKYHIPFTIHAGEVKVSEIKKAIYLKAKRLGHGVKIIDDDKLMKFIKDKKILLEICPTSNIQTNVFKEYINHPVKDFFDKDILFSVSTDNSTISNITLTEEYIKLYRTFNFTLADFKKMNINAVNYAFLDNLEKKALIDKIESFN